MLNEIRTGDVLVFKAGDDWIGKSIAWLTKSDVSHAAIMNSDKTIAEMGLSGISVSEIRDNPKCTPVHVLRLDPAMDPTPLAKAASVYVDSKVAYDFPSLVLIGGLLIYREIRPTPKLKTITDIILRLACSEVDKLIMRLRKDKKKTMVCSQLVYQCYLDCPKEYHIRIDDGNLQASGDTSASSQTIRLIDQLEGTDFSSSNITESSASHRKLSPEQAAEELYAALLDAEETQASGLDLSIDMNSILPTAKTLLAKLEQLLKEHSSNIPIQALFITPGDLLNHAINLTKVGDFPIERC